MTINQINLYSATVAFFIALPSIGLQYISYYDGDTICIGPIYRPYAYYYKLDVCSLWIAIIIFINIHSVVKVKPTTLCTDKIMHVSYINYEFTNLYRIMRTSIVHLLLTDSMSDYVKCINNFNILFMGYFQLYFC